MIYCYLGHPKSGSTWLGGLMGRFSIEAGFNYFYGQLALNDNFKKIASADFDVIISQNSSYENLKKLNKPYKGFHVIRDPRDICVSSYFSYKKSHPINGWTQLQELRNQLNSMNFEDGLVEIMKFNKWFFELMENWNYQDKNIYEIKYEKLILDPVKYLSDIFVFMNLMDEPDTPFKTLKSLYIGYYNRLIHKINKNHLLRIKQHKLPKNNLLKINDDLSFVKLAKGRKSGTENINSHYRKGISGDWKNHFNDAHKNRFKEMFGDLLITLNYEKDNNW